MFVGAVTGRLLGIGLNERLEDLGASALGIVVAELVHGRLHFEYALTVRGLRTIEYASMVRASAWLRQGSLHGGVPLRWAGTSASLVRLWYFGAALYGRFLLFAGILS